jgi:hypothetical protein
MSGEVNNVKPKGGGYTDFRVKPWRSWDEGLRPRGQRMEWVVLNGVESGDEGC